MTQRGRRIPGYGDDRSTWGLLEAFRLKFPDYPSSPNPKERTVLSEHLGVAMVEYVVARELWLHNDESTSDAKSPWLAWLTLQECYLQFDLPHRYLPSAPSFSVDAWVGHELWEWVVYVHGNPFHARTVRIRLELDPDERAVQGGTCLGYGVRRGPLLSFEGYCQIESVPALVRSLDTQLRKLRVVPLG